MGITKTVPGKCHKCGIETDHDIVAMHADGIGYCFGMECPACGQLVPEKAWRKYQRTGDIVVKMEAKKWSSASGKHMNNIKAAPGRYI